MNSLLSASGEPAFIQLVNTLYDIPHVLGFALDVDPADVALLHGQKPKLTLNKALETGDIPAGWEQYCVSRPISALESVSINNTAARLVAGQGTT
jgi:hypothetical protein